MRKSVSKAVGLAALAALGLTGEANAAAVLSQAKVQVTDFILYKDTGTSTPLTLADFASLSFVDSLSNTSQLNGINGPTQTVNEFNFTPSVDAALSCVGNCGAFGQNDFNLNATPPATTYARSDSLLKDQPIGVPAIPLGADSSTISQTSLSGGGNSGTAQSGILLSSTLTFVLNQTTNAGLGFSALSQLQTWSSADSRPGTVAGASNKLQFTLTDSTGATVFDWLVGSSSSGLNNVVSACAITASSTAGANQQQAVKSCSGAFSANIAVVLVAGEEYSLAISQVSQTNARAVPEPGALALIGIAFAGMGWLGRRRIAA